MSLLRHLYYELKPYVPTSARMTFRRALARRVLAKSKHCWPVLEQAAKTPQGWQGWPQGKRFALVLTHDVESEKGVKNCLGLATIEERLGFRSSFNFVPEGGYETPAHLREELKARGFEVGVHDLRHDGKLFRSEKNFRKAAEKINGYLQAWDAVGFRSGFMHHNLEWLHHLDIAYDMSTFDTDPFEPQPDGAETIFPFWVPRPSVWRNGVHKPELNGGGTHRHEGGYIELPYTLPQDSTLYFLLSEPDAGVWKRKIDWIVRHGGMALVNVHPDYISLNRSTQRHQYGVGIYSEFLEYINSEYPGEYWLALPREVAAFVTERRSSAAVR